MVYIFIVNIISLPLDSSSRFVNSKYLSTEIRFQNFLGRSMQIKCAYRPAPRLLVNTL